MNGILFTEAREEVLNTLRNPAALFFSMIMPVGFFALTLGIFGAGDGFGLAGFVTFGTFAVTMVVVMNPGVGLAEAREIGWLRIKRASGAPLSATLVAKVVAAVPYAIAVLAAMIGMLAATGNMASGLGPTLAAAGALVVATLPFALFGIAAGARFGVNAATALLNAVVFPMVIASGLWFPLEMLPEVVQRVAPWLPTYHVAELATGVGTSSLPLRSLAVIGATAVVGAIVAAIAYRSAKT